MMQCFSNDMPTCMIGIKWLWKFRGKAELHKKVSLELDLKDELDE